MADHKNEEFMRTTHLIRTSENPHYVLHWHALSSPVISLFDDQVPHERTFVIVNSLAKIIFNCCEKTEIFVPQNDCHEDQQMYKAFNTWFLGKFFFQLCHLELSDIHEICIQVQLKILKVIGTYNLQMLSDILREYIGCYEDIQCAMGHIDNQPGLCGKWFTPSITGIATPKIEFKHNCDIRFDAHVRAHAKKQIIKILSEMIYFIMEADPSLLNKVIEILCDSFKIPGLQKSALFALSQVLHLSAMESTVQHYFIRSFLNLLTEQVHTLKGINCSMDEKMEFSSNVSRIMKIIATKHGTSCFLDDYTLFQVLFAFVCDSNIKFFSEELQRIICELMKECVKAMYGGNIPDDTLTCLYHRISQCPSLCLLIEMKLKSEVRELYQKLDEEELCESSVHRKIRRAENLQSTPSWFLLSDEIQRCLSSCQIVYSGSDGVFPLEGQVNCDIKFIVPKLSTILEIILCAARVCGYAEKFDSSSVPKINFACFPQIKEDLIRKLFIVLAYSPAGGGNGDAYMHVAKLCFQIVGHLLRLPEVTSMPDAWIHSLILLLALPFFKTRGERFCIDSVADGLLPVIYDRIAGNEDVELKIICIDFIQFVPNDLLLQFRISMVLRGWESNMTELRTQVIRCMPYLVTAAEMESTENLLSILMSAAVTDDELYHVAVSEVLASMACTLASSTFCVRYTEESLPKLRLLCKSCDCEEIATLGYQCSEELQICNVVEFEDTIENIISVLRNSSTVVKCNLVKSFKKLSGHIPSLCSRTTMSECCHFLQDPEFEVRLHFSKEVKYLIFQSNWLEKMEKFSQDKNIVLSEDDNQCIKRATEIIFVLKKEILTALRLNVPVSNALVEETLLTTVKTIGSLPGESMLLDCFVLLLTYVSFSEASLTPIVPSIMNDIMHSHSTNLIDTFKKYKRKICTTMARLVIIQKGEGDDYSVGCLRRMASLFEFSSAREFLQRNICHFLPTLILQAIQLSETSPVVSTLSPLLQVDERTLLTQHFQHVYPFVYIHGNKYLMQVLSYVEDKTGTPVGTLMENTLQKLVKEFLFYYHEAPDQVVAAIKSLAEIDETCRGGGPNMTHAELVNYLQSQLLGILVHFDNKLLRKHVADSDKGLLLLSLARVTELMGSTNITQFSLKVLLTLKSALSLNLKECSSQVFRAWKSFVETVDIRALGPLLSQIVVSLEQLLEEFPQEISEILNFLIVENEDEVSEYLNELHFLPAIDILKDVTRVLQKYTDPGCLTFTEKLILATKFVAHDNVEVHVKHLNWVRIFLVENKRVLHERIKNEGACGSMLRSLIAGLVNASRESQAVSKLCGLCLGELGAIDPAFLSRDNKRDVNEDFIFEVMDRKFACRALCEITRAYMTSTDAQNIDSFAYAIQELLSLYGISNSEDAPTYDVWCEFPDNIKHIMVPFLTSRYRAHPTEEKVLNVHPVFRSEFGSTYHDWLYSWVVKLIDVSSDTPVGSVFLACKLSMKKDINILLFFLPYVLVYAIVNGDDGQRRMILEEILTVIKEPHRGSNEDLVPCEETLFQLHKKCSKVVFSQVDFLMHWMTKWKKIPGYKFDRSYVSEASIVREFFGMIPKLEFSALNCGSGEYTRSLMFYEQAVRAEPDLLHTSLSLLGKIYVGLDEPDAVSGTAVVRTVDPPLEDQILLHEVKGQYQDALLYYERLRRTENMTDEHKERMVKCYLALNEPSTGDSVCDSFSKEDPLVGDKLSELKVETSWRLGHWDHLKELLNNFNMSRNHGWSIELAQCLLAVREASTIDISHQVMQITNRLMEPLSSLAFQKGAYQQGYHTVVKLHMISELQRCAEVTNICLENIERKAFVEKIVSGLFKEWELRLQIVQQSTKVIQPILDMRRTMLEIMKGRIVEKNPTIAATISKEIGKLWLKSAEVASKANFCDLSSNYLLAAEEFNLHETFIAKAKHYWQTGDNSRALEILRRGVERYFPQPTSGQQMALKEEKILAEAKLLIAMYSEELVNVDIDKTIEQYKDAVESCRSWEESLVCIAQCYDRISSQLDPLDMSKIDMDMHIVNLFGKSMLYGSAHLYLSMPRMLRIWLDLGTTVIEEQNKSGSKRQNESLKSMSSALTKMTKIVDSYLEKLPPFMFFTAFSQITSRICHPHPEVYHQLRRIIIKMVKWYPHQSLWRLLVFMKSSFSLRARRCQEILRHFEDEDMKKLISDYSSLAVRLIELSNKDLQEAQEAKMHVVLHALPRLLSSSGFSHILMPVQKLMVPVLPRDPDSVPDPKFNPFPNPPVYIVGVEDEIIIMASLQKPKKIGLKGSDGRVYQFMCKPQDDLRRDARVMEFNVIVNKFLQDDPEARRRNLHIRTYHVVPLNEECGLIEWVPNLVGFRPIMHRLYKDKSLYTGSNELRQMMCKLNDSLEVKVDTFVNKLIPRHPPVFHEWFEKTFPNPNMWYLAKTSYIRTTAVMSIVGYIMGLGDRHGENILLDSTTGEIVHVDFNCLFNKGEHFDWAERVPFRLTHNMVDAMGPLKVEGMFRNACEITLKTLRDNIQPLMSVLHPFVYDPLVAWSRKQPQKKDSGETTNEKALENIENIENRLKGIMPKENRLSLPLSVEGHVDHLIRESTNIENLAQMYIGWAAYL